MSIDDITNMLSDRTNEVFELREEIAQEKQKSKELIEALEFYGDLNNYGKVNSLLFTRIKEKQRYGEIVYGGETARQCLEKWKSND